MSMRDRIGGVVITFIDITTQKRAAHEVIVAKNHAEHIVDTIDEPLMILTPDLRVKSANRAFYAHFQTQPGIEVGEWFVQQQHVWLDHQRARQRHALLLAAGKLVRCAVGIFFHLHNPKRFGHPLFFLRRAHGPHLQAVSHVLRHSQVRPQGVVLKNHPRVAPMRRHTAHRLVANGLTY